MAALISIVELAVLVGIVLLTYYFGRRSGRLTATRSCNELPSFACSCGGEWGKWSPVAIEGRPRDPEFPLTGGTLTSRVQTRYCAACGRADRRVLS